MDSFHFVVVMVVEAAEDQHQIGDVICRHYIDFGVLEAVKTVDAAQAHLAQQVREIVERMAAVVTLVVCYGRAQGWHPQDHSSLAH